MLVMDSQQSERGRQRRKAGDGRPIHCCCICGKVGTWDSNWKSYGSEKQMYDGSTIPKFCSEICRILGGDDASCVTLTMLLAANDSEWREPKVMYRPATRREKYVAEFDKQLSTLPRPPGERRRQINSDVADRKTELALALLDRLADMWFEESGLSKRNWSETVVRAVKQAHAEGLYAGRWSALDAHIVPADRWTRVVDESVLLYVVHRNADFEKDEAARKDKWEGWHVGQWSDFDGGRWVWSGLGGRITHVARLPTHPSPK
jgi:hypothetical protein